MATVSGHGCTTYCRDGEHCDLVYSADYPDETLLRQSLALSYQRDYDVRVTRIAPASEAPDLSMFSAASLRVMAGSGRDDTRRWLLWWRDER